MFDDSGPQQWSWWESAGEPQVIAVLRNSG